MGTQARGRLARAAKRQVKPGARRPRALVAADAQILEAAPRVIELRRQGFKGAEIARMLGRSASYVSTILTAAREEWTAARIEQTALLIQGELTRLDELEREVAERMDGAGDLAFAALAGRRLDCLERRAKLLGLDRPTRHDVSLPGVESALRDLTPERREQLAMQAVLVLRGGVAPASPGDAGAAPGA